MGTPDGNRKWALPAILIGLMSVFLGLVSMANVVSNAAATSANEASGQSAQVAADLTVHEARQNGSFESIDSQLSTLRTYHSTLRGELKEQRKLMDELLRRSYSEHPVP